MWWTWFVVFELFMAARLVVWKRIGRRGGRGG
jgi:hypothetical protein